MEALKELVRMLVFLVWKTAEILLQAAGMSLAFMVVGIYSLVLFSLGMKMDNKGELSYRR